MLEFLTQRASERRPLPPIGGARSARELVAKLFQEGLNPEVDNMRVFPGTARLENREGRSYVECDEFDDDELTLSFTAEQTGMWHIGRKLERLEKALPGAAETVLALINRANEATCYPLATPWVVRDLLVSYQWQDVDSRLLRPEENNGADDYSLADEAVSQALVDYQGYDPDDLPDHLLPSKVFAELLGNFRYSQVIYAEPRVQLTEAAFRKAGFGAKRAADLVRRLETDIPALCDRLHVVRNKKRVMYDSQWCTFGAGMALGNSSTAVVDLLDGVLEERASAGEPDHVLRVAALPHVRRKVKGSPYGYVNTNKRLDGLEVFTDFLNLLGHLDQVVEALN